MNFLLVTEDGFPKEYTLDILVEEYSYIFRSSGDNLRTMIETIDLPVGGWAEIINLGTLIRIVE